MPSTLHASSSPVEPYRNCDLSKKAHRICDWSKKAQIQIPKKHMSGVITHNHCSLVPGRNARRFCVLAIVILTALFALNSSLGGGALTERRKTMEFYLPQAYTTQPLSVGPTTHGSDTILHGYLANHRDSCQDAHEFCPAWVVWCNASSVYMTKHCPRACGICDARTALPQWPIDCKAGSAASLPPAATSLPPAVTVVISWCKYHVTFMERIAAAFRGRGWVVVVFSTCKVPVSRGLRCLASQIIEREPDLPGLECRSYLEYITSNYAAMTDYTVFLQDDFLWHTSPRESKTEWLYSRGECGKDNPGECPKLLDMVTLWAELLWSEAPFPVLQLGSFEIDGQLSPCSDADLMRNVSACFTSRQYFLGEPEIFPYASVLSDLLLTEKGKAVAPGTNVKFLVRAAALFAVSRSRVQARTLTSYTSLFRFATTPRPDLDKVAPTAPDASLRKQCCAFERLWHVVFGEEFSAPIDPHFLKIYSGLVD